MVTPFQGAKGKAREAGAAGGVNWKTVGKVKPGPIRSPATTAKEGEFRIKHSPVLFVLILKVLG